MKLVASVIVHDEHDRYLEQTVGSLTEFCDEVRVLDDGSTDGGPAWLRSLSNVHVLANSGPPMFEDEGAARNRLLTWTLMAAPTHVLSIDADEIVTDGPQIRRACEEEGRQVWTLCMQEVWAADHDHVHVRCDGGWCPHEIPMLWRAPENVARAVTGATSGGTPAVSRGERTAWVTSGGTRQRQSEQWRIQDRKLACGREPIAVVRAYQRGGATPTGAGVYHLGWADRQERQRRYERYVTADGGRFHANAHLQSIMWPDQRVITEARPWPEALHPRKDALLRRINR